MLPRSILVLILSRRPPARPQPLQTIIPKWSLTRSRMVRPLFPLSRWDASLMEALAPLALLRQRIMERRGQVVFSLGSPNGQQVCLEVLALMIGPLMLQ